MHSDPKLVARLDALADARGLQRKGMFGGYCWFLGGNLCCGVWHDKLILRLGEDAALEAMDRDHVVPMDITGKPMRAWAMAEPAGFRTARQLNAWVDKAVAFVETLPVKPKKKSAARAKARKPRQRKSQPAGRTKPAAN